MTKSSAVLFILIFSLIFKLEELVSPTPLVTLWQETFSGRRRRCG